MTDYSNATFESNYVYDPLRNAKPVNGVLIDTFTGIPIATPASTPAVGGDLQLRQPVATTQPQQPQQQNATFDVGKWEKESDVYKRSSVKQRKLFEEYTDQAYKQWMEANPASSLSKDELREQLRGNLSKDPKNYITKDAENNPLRDVLGTVATAVTGTADAAAGLINAGASAVFGKNELTSGLAKATHSLDEKAHSINSANRQDFDLQFQEVMNDESMDWGDKIAFLASHPWYSGLDLVGMVGAGGLAGGAAKIGLKAAGKALEKNAVQKATKNAAKEMGVGAAGQDALARTAVRANQIARPVTNAEHINKAANIIGQGALGAGMAAQTIGQQNGDFQLTSQQALGAGIDGLIAALATHVSMKYGYTPESILLGATPVKVSKTEIPSLLKTVGKSIGVEIASNGIQGAADAILTTGYDKDGNLDLSKVDWNQVEDAAIASGAVGGLLGGIAGTVGGIRDRRASSTAIQADKAAREAEVNETGPTATDPGDASGTREQRAADDTQHTDPVGAQPTAFGDDYLNRLRASMRAQQQPISSQSTAFGNDYLNGISASMREQQQPVFTRTDPLSNASSQPVVDPLRGTAGAEQPQTAGEPESAQTAEQSFANDAQQIYNSTSPGKREAAMAKLREDIRNAEASPEMRSLQERQATRATPGYTEYYPETAAADAQQLRKLDAMRAMLDQFEAFHQLATNPAKVYNASASTGRTAQAIIDGQIQSYADKWRGDAGQQPDPETIAQARQMMADYKKVPDQNKASFVAQINKENAEWFTRPIDERDGRTFDTLEYDANSLPEPADRAQALALANEARPEATRRIRLQNLLEGEHQAWQRANAESRIEQQRSVHDVTPAEFRDIAAKTILQAQDGPSIKAAKDAGAKALNDLRTATRVAGKFAKTAVAPEMRTRLERDMSGEQRGSDQFAKTAAELTGIPSEEVLAPVQALRELDPLAYGKHSVVDTLAKYEGNPASSGATWKRTTSYLNYLQEKQDAITQAIGEWRPLALEDVRRINGGRLPELAEVGNYDPGDTRNTRRYVQRIVNDVVDSGSLSGEDAARMRLLRDWLLADTSEATYLTAEDARLALADFPNIRQLRTMIDGDVLASGKQDSADPMYGHVPEIRAALIEGDLSAALGRAIAVMPDSRKAVLGALRNMVDRLSDPVRVRISEEPLSVNGREVRAYFDRPSGEIVIDTRYADVPYVIAHEAVHAATHNYIADGMNGQLTGKRLRAFQALSSIWRESQRKAEMPEYARTNLHEFAAETFSNPEMQEFLKSFQSKEKSLPRLRSMYRSFVAVIRRMVGLPEKSYSALEDVVGLTHVLQTNGQYATTQARVFESQGLQSGVLSRYIENKGQASRDEFGKMERLEDGTFYIETDADSVFGHSVHYFDEFKDAQAFVEEQYGAEIRSLSHTESAIRKGLMSRYDVKNPTISKVAQAVEQALGRYIPKEFERTREIVQRIVQAAATGAQWLVMQTDRLEIVKSIDRALKAAGIDSALYETFESNRQKTRALGRIGSDLSVLIRTIGQQLRPIGRTADDLGRYMYALHGLERNAKYGWKGDTSGFTHNDAQGQALTGTRAMQAYLDAMPQRDKDVLHAAAQNVWKQWQAVLKEEERSGILSTEQYRKMGGLDENGNREDGAYQYYVPFRNEDDLNGWLTPKQGVTGRTTEAANPFAALMIQLQQRMGAVHRNDSLRDLGEILQEHPIPEVSNPKTFKLRWDTNGKLLALPEFPANSKNAVYWREGGTLKVVHVNTSTTEGKYLLKALRSNNANQNAMLRGLGSITRFMTMFQTSLSPAFQLKTIAWDIMTTLLNFQGAYGNGITAAQGAKLGLQSVLRSARVMPMVVNSRYRGYSDNAAFNLFGRMGGGMGAGATLSQLNISQAISFDGISSSRSMIAADGLLKGSMKIAKGHATSALHALHSADDALRFSTFVEFVKHHTGEDITTMSEPALRDFASRHREVIDRGIKGSKEINGNFERQGNGGLLHNIYAYWNATMQGSRLFASIASSKQGQYGMMALLTMGVADALYAISSPDDDDGAGGSKYAALRNRKSTLLFGDGGYPLAYEARMPFTLGNSLVLALCGKISWGQAIKDVGASFGDMFFPLMPLDTGDTGASLLYAVTPTAVQMVHPVFLGTTAFNTSTEASYVVGPDGKRIANPLPVETAKPGTGWFPRQVAEWLDAIGLGSIAFPGRIDAVMSSVFGGVYNLLNSISSPSAEDIIAERNPLWAAVSKDFRPQTNDYESRTKYQELQQERSAAYRRAVQADGGRDMLANGTLPGINRADLIDKQLKKQQAAIRVRGKKQSDWLVVLSKANESGDEVAAAEAKTALYEIRQRQSMLEVRATQQLKELK